MNTARHCDVSVGIVPQLVLLIHDPTAPDVREQAVWAVGNIAGDEPSLRCDGCCSWRQTGRSLVSSLLQQRSMPWLWSVVAINQDSQRGRRQGTLSHLALFASAAVVLFNRS